MTEPLAGIVVADLTLNVAGPFCTQILGDMGADVIKLERPGKGDDARAWAPPFWGTESATFMSLNRNKRSLALDLKAPDGRAIARRLIEKATVFVQSLAAGVVEALGLGWDDVHALNPRLIYCSVTAFGARGPLSALPGYDALMQAYGGLLSVNGHPGQPPARIGASIVDMGTGMWAALGILGALKERDRTGLGSHVTTSLFDTALMWSSYHLMNYFASGEAPQPQGSGTQMIVPYEAFPTADGYVMLAAGSDGLFAGMCEALGIPATATDPRFVDNPARVRNRKALYDLIAGVTQKDKTSHWVERLRAAGVPCAPILSVDQVAAEPQTEASGMLLRAPHPRVPDYRSVALPLEWAGRRHGVTRVPPLLGEHTAEILGRLGYSGADIERLAAGRVVQLRNGR
ncbi:MAG: CoA transferase [Candidatus Rokubacteria bacterium]|nr:CoA transferase [Candidatus Rokubacteria bacterium]